MNDIEKILEQFLEVESERDLFNTLVVNNVKIWHYIRKAIHDMVVEKKCGVINPNSLKKEYKKESGVLNWIDTNILKNQFRISQKDVLVINHERRVKQGKYYSCVYTDEWLKDFSESYYVFEHAYSGLVHFKPARTKNLRYVDKQKYVKIFRKKYNHKDFYREITTVTHCITDMAEKGFALKLTARDIKRINQLVQGTVCEREICRDYWQYILRRVQPKVIIYVVGYFLDNMVLAELGKELGIPTIEITHGQIGSAHVCYNFKIAESLKAFPDYLFVPGQREIDSMRIPIPRERIYAVGAPELEKTKEMYQKLLAGKRKRKKIVTFLSSGEKELGDVAAELSAKLNPEQFKIYFKLHPSEYTNWKKKYQMLENTGVSVVDDAKHDIYYYLAASDYVIGVASATLVEATAFQCHILVYKIGRCFWVKDLVQNGIATYIDSAKDAAEYIAENREERESSDYYYKSGSSQMICEKVKEIMRHNACKGERNE